ncbi:hypothetical protein M758_UG268300 [Ceratodon purpureus]|nr:hypothetical protein M758_UG268300 [Ceratodon purpureus]
MRRRDGRCVKADCSHCRDVGLEWKSGFCDRGCWMERIGTAFLDPRVRSELPKRLLESILARLPVDAIARMRCVCKEWRRMASSSSWFTEECRSVQSQLWALVGFGHGTLTCWVRAYDVKAGKWHAIGIESIPQSYRNAIRVFDGGLACFCLVGLERTISRFLYAIC